MRVYDKQNGYSRWFRLLNEVVCVAVFMAVVIALLLGIQYGLCTGN